MKKISDRELLERLRAHLDAHGLDIGQNHLCMNEYGGLFLIGRYFSHDKPDVAGAELAEFDLDAWARKHELLRENETLGIQKKKASSAKA